MSITGSANCPSCGASAKVTIVDGQVPNDQGEFAQSVACSCGQWFYAYAKIMPMLVVDRVLPIVKP